jgi:hypothetical protein
VAAKRTARNIHIILGLAKAPLSKVIVDPLVTNHTLIPLLGMVDVWKIGCSTYEPEFSQMIREGRAEKGHWRNMFEMVEYSAKTGKFVKETVREGLRRLDLKPSDVGLSEEIYG